MYEWMNDIVAVAKLRIKKQFSRMWKDFDMTLLIPAGKLICHIPHVSPFNL